MSSRLALADRLFRRCLPALLVALVAIFSLNPAWAADGDVDPTFVTELKPADVNTAVQIFSVLVQPDGKVLPLGLFSTKTSGGSYLSAMRLGLDGATDPGFTPIADANAVTRYCGIVQTDGKILIGGVATASSVVPSLFRLNADGTVDPNYVPAGISDSVSSSTAVFSMIRQPDGKVIITGRFTDVGGHPHARIARLNADGTEDTTFNPVFGNGASSPIVLAVNLQADGRVLVGGSFSSVNGTPRSNVARLNADGSLDALDLATDGQVRSILVQGDGNVLIGGSFNTVSVGAVVSGSYPMLCRLNTATDTLDEAFRVSLPNFAGVNTVNQQIDGKIFVGGQTASPGLPVPFVRLNANGSVDSSFNPDSALQTLFGDAVLTISQQADGAVLIGRVPGSDGALPLNRNGVVRLKNAGGSQSLGVEATRVQWLRSGPLPEVSDATFKLSTDGGVTWSTLGAGARIAGGWELAGLSLPDSGILRVLSTPLSGGRSCIRSLLGYEQPFNLTGSQIAVEQPATRRVENGDSRDFGHCAIGQAVDRTFLVRNFGTADLTGLGLSITGADASSFGVISLPAPVPPGGSTNFTVRFRATSAGTKSAVLSIGNNTPGADPFQINLTGTAQPDGTPNPIYAEPAVTPQSNNQVTSVATDSNGTPIIGGQFASVGGYPRANIARFNADGSVDLAFDPGANPIYSLAAQPDGKLFVSDFRPGRVRRLNADGTPDNAFTPLSLSSVAFALDLQADGRLLVGGTFSGNGATNVMRVNADGSTDQSFIDPGIASQVNALEAVEDGKIVVSGNGTVFRLNSDGTADPSFTVPSSVAGVFCMVVQKDGRIIVGGRFSTASGQTRLNLARYLADGTLDPSFDPAPDGDVYGLALQADGRILVAGSFAKIGGLPHARLARLNPDGTVDSSLTADVAGSWVLGINLTPTGQIMVVGDLQSINGTTTPAVTQLYNTVGTSELSATRASRVQWLRGGTMGETHWTRFELSTDGGSTWTPLGQGTRISGGWELTGLSLPASGMLRASAITKTGGGSVFGGGGFSAVSEVASFTLDLTPPTVTAPVNGFTPLRVSAGTTLADYAAQATASDASGVTKTQSPPPGTILTAGKTHVTITATDGAGNTATLEFDVDVRPLAPVTTPVIASGAAAPGRLTSADLPDDAVIASFGPPAIDDAGNIAYVAKWTSAVGPVKRGTGLFLNDQCLAVDGGDASAVAAGAEWKSFSDPVVDGGVLACIAKLSTGASAVVRSNGASLEKVAMTGEVAPEILPGSTATFKSFKSVTVSSGVVAFLAQRTVGSGTPKVTAADDMGVWVQSAAIPLTLALREGNGINNRVFKTVTAFAGGDGSPGMGRGWLVVNGSGPQVLARVVFADGGQAVLVVDVNGGGMTTLTQTKNGGTGIAGTDFASYSVPARNAARDTAFLGSLVLKPGFATKADTQAIFASTSATMAPPENGFPEPDLYAPIVRLGGDALQGAKFSVLKDPVLASDGGIAFPATIKGGTVKGAAMQTLWWQPPGRNVGMFAQGGTDAAEVPGAKWKAFTSLAIAGGARGPIFAATLTPGKGAAGVWAVDFTGTTRLLFRTGAPIAAGGKALKSFKLLNATVGSTGVTRSFNDAAQVVWLATFSDKTTAILTTEVP